MEVVARAVGMLMVARAVVQVQVGLVVAEGGGCGEGEFGAGLGGT